MYKTKPTAADLDLNRKMALKPNIHQKPNLPPKPQLQSPWGQNSARRSAALDRVISRIEPGTVRQRALSLTNKQDGGGEDLNRHGKGTSNTKAAFQWSAGTVREQIQKLALSTERDKEKQENRQTELEEERKDQSIVSLQDGRSEPDGSEMEDNVGSTTLEEEQSTTPSCPLQEIHCHCICHLQRPGMKLVWVPLQMEEEKERHNMSTKREDEKKTPSRVETSWRDSRNTTKVITQKPPPLKRATSAKSPKMPQCINCRSFRLHHSPQLLVDSEDEYESMETLLPRPVPPATPQPADPHHAEEQLYLELLPSDDNIATPPTPPPRPKPPPRPPSTFKDTWIAQPVLAYMLSPRGCPPIRSPSSCERGHEAPPTRKTKSEEQRTHSKEPEKERQRISTDWVLDDDYEPLYQMYQRKVCEAEALLQGESPSAHRRSICETLGLQGPRTFRDQNRAQIGEVKLWQDLAVVKESGLLQTLSYTEKQRQECMFEVLTSEASYLRSMRVLKDHFLDSRELIETMVIHDRKSLFSNILQVYEVSERFMQDILDRIDQSVVISDVCDIIHQHAEKHFSVYTDYVRNQVYQEKTYSRLMQCNRAFCTVMRRLEESPLCRRLPFTSFMLLPFQRITRIKILIQSILKRTPEGSAEENTASKALATVSEIIRQANSQVGQMKQMEELIHIANILEFNKLKAIPLVSKTRTLEKQGELQELSKGGSLFGLRFRFSPIYIFLFNDLIILTARKSGNQERFVVMDHAHRSLVQVQLAEVSGPQLEHAFCLTLLENHQGNTCERLLKANTESDLHRWMAAFPSVSVLQGEKEEKVYEDWDCPQVRCTHQYVAKQADELSLEPCDIINVIRKTNEGWYEGVRLADRARGWFPQESVAEVTSEHQRRRNLREQYRIAMVTRTANYRPEI